MRRILGAVCRAQSAKLQRNRRTEPDGIAAMVIVGGHGRRRQYRAFCERGSCSAADAACFQVVLRHGVSCNARRIAPASRPRHEPGFPPMNDLSPLVETPGAHTVHYIDPAFPDRRCCCTARARMTTMRQTPVLFVHHGVGRNGPRYRDYWLRHVDQAGILAIAIEFPEASFPDYLWYHFGNLHAEDGTPNPREQWTYGIDERLFAALREQGVTGARALRVVRPFCRRAVRAPDAVVWFSRPGCGRGQCECRYLRMPDLATPGHSASAKRVSGRMHCANWWSSPSR